LVTLLNPIQHSANPTQTATYKVEPYVVAADVYAVAPHTGRGGWTWYTGSAGWMYRLLTETLLGLNPEGNQLYLRPRLPENWSTCKIHYRYGETPYQITVSRSPDGAPGPSRTFVDGKELAGDAILLEDDHREHAIEVRL
jgi:cellobiose phosphorylase